MLHSERFSECQASWFPRLKSLWLLTVKMYERLCLWRKVTDPVWIKSKYNTPCYWISTITSLLCSWTYNALYTCNWRKWNLLLKNAVIKWILMFSAFFTFHYAIEWCRNLNSLEKISFLHGPQNIYTKFQRYTSAIVLISLYKVWLGWL